MRFRKFAGLTTALLIIAAMVPLLMAPALAQEATTCDDLGYPEGNKVGGGGTISGDWGSASWTGDEDTTLELNISEGWAVEICVKAGTELDEFLVDSDDGVITMGHGISHVSWKNPTEDTTTTTEGETTTTTEGETTTTTEGETTTTTEGETTTTTEGETTTTTEGETTTTTEAETTTTTEAETTTTTEEEVEGETTSTTEAEEEVAGETTSTTEAEVEGETTSTTEDDETEDTLPFTGIGTDGIALAALIALASGAGLIFLTGRSDESEIEG